MTLWTPTELRDHDFGSVKFYIDPIVTPRSVLMIFGPREAGKTQLLFTMFRAMFENGLLLNRFKASPARVALVEVDMTVVTTQERIQKAHVDYAFPDNQFLIATPDGFNALTTPVTQWIRDINTFKPDVVAFDSLRKIHSEDESNPSTPSRVYGRLKHLFPGASLWFTHHVKKPPATWIMDEKNYDPGEDPNVYRGTSAWLDDADAAIYLHKDFKTDKRSFRITRARYAPDSVKREVFGVSIDSNSMFVNVGDLSPKQYAISYKLKNPGIHLDQIVQELQDKFPGKSRQTYYNWAKNE